MFLHVCVCTYRQVGEHAEGALQEGDQVDQVVAGVQSPASLHRGHPIVISQLQELVDLGVQAGVDLRLGCVTSVLQDTRLMNNASLSYCLPHRIKKRKRTDRRKEGGSSAYLEGGGPVQLGSVRRVRRDVCDV